MSKTCHADYSYWPCPKPIEDNVRPKYDAERQAYCFWSRKAGQPSVPSMLTRADRHQHREPKALNLIVRGIEVIRMGRCLARKLTMQLLLDPIKHVQC